MSVRFNVPAVFTAIWFAGAVFLFASPRVEYVDTGRELGLLGFDYSGKSKDGGPVYKKGTTEIRFAGEDRNFYFNGVRALMGFEGKYHDEKFLLRKRDYLDTIRPLIRNDVYSKEVITRIAIDPGHGGKDNGAGHDDDHVTEKALTLDLARTLKSQLEAKGFEVMLTRKDDKYIALKERSDMANAWGAELFLSLHFNSLGKTSVRGLETYCFTPSGLPSASHVELKESDMEIYPANLLNAKNLLLGYNIHARMVGNLNALDRGLKRARFAVLKTMKCPAVLIEAGFISNADEREKIMSPLYRKLIAQSIVQGVLDFAEKSGDVR